MCNTTLRDTHANHLKKKWNSNYGGCDCFQNFLLKGYLGMRHHFSETDKYVGGFTPKSLGDTTFKNDQIHVFGCWSGIEMMKFKNKVELGFAISYKEKYHQSYQTNKLQNAHMFFQLHFACMDSKLYE